MRHPAPHTPGTLAIAVSGLQVGIELPGPHGPGQDARREAEHPLVAVLSLAGHTRARCSPWTNTKDATEQAHARTS